MAELANALPHLFAANPLRLAVAYSGGADSSCLLHLAHDWAKQYGASLFACHVHHGLSAHADDWLAHCQQRAAMLEIEFAFERISLPGTANLEARARAARYAALARMCAAQQATLLLCAHHQQDQAETVLLQWMRGAQPATGMEALSQIGPASSPDALWLARPLLNCARPLLLQHLAHLTHLAQLKQVAQAASDPANAQATAQADHVEDPSNLDPRFARNALRHQVLPKLAQIFPAADALLARQAQHGQTTRRLLRVLAEQDLAQQIGPEAARAALASDSAVTGADGSAPTLPLAVLSAFDAERTQNILRHWLQASGLRLPSAAWLEQAICQLQQAREDAQPCVRHPLAEIHRYRDQIYLTRPALPAAEPETFRWHGETELPFPAFGGSLWLLPVAPGSPGFDPDWLAQQTLQIGHRQGGERLKLAANRPSRSLKQHYQSMDVPGWLRLRLPLVWLAPSTTQAPGHRTWFNTQAAPNLLFAAGIGSASAFLSEPDAVAASQPIDATNATNATNATAAAVQRINFQWRMTHGFK